MSCSERVPVLVYLPSALVSRRKMLVRLLLRMPGCLWRFCLRPGCSPVMRVLRGVRVMARSSEFMNAYRDACLAGTDNSA